MVIAIQIRGSRTDSLEAGNSFAAGSTVKAGNSNRCLFDSSCRKPTHHTPGSIEHCLSLRGYSKPAGEGSSDSSFVEGNSALLMLASFCLQSEIGTCVSSKHCSLEARNRPYGIVFGRTRKDQKRSQLLLAGMRLVEACKRLPGPKLRHFDTVGICSRTFDSCDSHQLAQILDLLQFAAPFQSQ